MILDERDRRRVLLVGGLTVAMLLWSAKGDNAVGSQAALATTTPIGSPAAGPAIAPALDELSPHLVEPAFLSGSNETLPPQPLQYDVGAPPVGTSMRGLAGFKRFSSSSENKRACGTSLVPFGTRIVVTNTDNGYRLACTNLNIKPLTDDLLIVIDTDSFGVLADLADAPVPVEISF